MTAQVAETRGRKLTTADFMELERRDEEQILAEIQGQVIEEMVYQFPMGGRTVTGISWVGTKEVARRYGKIDIEPMEIRETPDAWIVIVKGRDLEKGYGLLGVSTCPKLRKKRDGSEEPNPFALQTAASKAQRNAIRNLIPETFIKTVIAEWLKAKKHPSRQPARREPPKRVDAKATVKPRRQPPVVDPIGSAEDDPDVNHVVKQLRDQDLKTGSLILVKKNGNVWIQHPEGLTQDKFNDYNDVIHGELGAEYHRDLRAWEVEP